MAVAASAGRATTSTPWMRRSVAPLMTASNMACSAGEGVWWTISRRGTPRIVAWRSPHRRDRLLGFLGRHARGLLDHLGRYAPAGRDHFVDDPVLQRLLGGHEVVTIDVSL